MKYQVTGFITVMVSLEVEAKDRDHAGVRYGDLLIQDLGPALDAIDEIDLPELTVGDTGFTITSTEEVEDDA